METLRRLIRRAFAALCIGVLLLLTSTASYSQRVALETQCDVDVLFSDGRLIGVNWHSAEGNIAHLPLHSTCWLRLTRPANSAIVGRPDNQFLLFENSWGSNFSLFSPDGQLLARSTIQGDRYRVLADKAWIYYPLGADAPQVLYAQIQTQHPFSSVRHRFDQRNGDKLVATQQRTLRDVAIAWVLFGAGLFAALFSVFQRNWQYAIFSAFALAFALTMLSDRGELAPFGLTAASSVLSLAYPLSGLLLAWLAWSVGKFSRYAPWAARAILAVILLYGSVALWQLGMMGGLNLRIAYFEPYADAVYNVAAFLQLLVFWASFQAWRRGDRISIFLMIGIAPLILFEIQISDWLADFAPLLASNLKDALGSSLRLISYLLLPAMFFAAIAFRAQQAQREAIRLAENDQLTNLPNRDHFLRIGQTNLNKADRSVLLAINIDRLKAINDVLGFHVGDAVIAEVADRLAQLKLGLVARIQTSQFCLLVDKAGKLPEVRQHIELAFSKAIVVEGQTLDLSLSIGVAIQSGETLAALLRNSETALGVAKATKVNWLTYDHTMDTTRPESLSLLSELSRAIETNELRLYLQPKVRLADGQIGGAEALVRWLHPTRGMVPPNEFIPFAEQTGKISALTLWVVREGARITAKWRQEGHPSALSINVSTHDLRDPLFVSRVKTLVLEQGALAQDIRLEVTESGMMDDPETSLTALHALRDAGFSISIDDFGTGYSSLSYLQRMPVAELKIDRSFVRNVQRGTEGAKLLDSIIALGHRMGLSVIAEGAETADECALLQSLGCDYLQGWYVAKAMPVSEFETWRSKNDPFELGLS